MEKNHHLATLGQEEQNIYTVATFPTWLQRESLQGEKGGAGGAGLGSGPLSPQPMGFPAKGDLAAQWRRSHTVQGRDRALRLQISADPVFGFANPRYTRATVAGMVGKPQQSRLGGFSGHKEHSPRIRAAGGPSLGATSL